MFKYCIECFIPHIQEHSLFCPRCQKIYAALLKTSREMEVKEEPLLFFNSERGFYYGVR